MVIFCVYNIHIIKRINMKKFLSQAMKRIKMQATTKSAAVDNLINSMFGIDRNSTIAKNKCTWCGVSVSKESFKDETSLNEYRISGMCQKCQDSIWG